MPNVLVNDEYLSDIADAIRSKLSVATTYKPSEMANAIDSIGGGGGVQTAEGYIELSDTNTGNITVPVNLTSASYFLINLYAVETGEVSGGVVTKYSNVEIPTAFSDTTKNFVFNYFAKYPRNPAPVVYRDDTNLSSITEPSNIQYIHARRGMNGAGISLTTNPTITANGCTLGTSNATRHFCVVGAYAKFKYEVQWW